MWHHLQLSLHGFPSSAVPVQEFVPVARELEKNWTVFSPHYIVWVCPRVYRQSAECQSQCIHQGRYCTPDPDGDLEGGYSGSDVVQVSLILIAEYLHLAGVCTVITIGYSHSLVNHGADCICLYKQGCQLASPFFSLLQPAF